jgi:hypothetical protein
MNDEESGCCNTNMSCFNIPVDEEGNNIVTGEDNHSDYADWKYFTCIDLEVFSVVYEIHPYQDPNFESYLNKQKEAIEKNVEFRKNLKKKRSNIIDQ